MRTVGGDDAFGNILQETGPSVPGGLTYTSRQYHSRSGLYYYRARWYDPELGRFLTPDPIGHLGGVNFYVYVLDDPVNWYDPLGLLTYVVAEGIVDLAKADNILRFDDKSSYDDAIANIPIGENQIIIISHGEREYGGEMDVEGRIIRGRDTIDPLINRRGDFSQKVAIEFRVCNIFKGQSQSLKCALQHAFPQGTISGYDELHNYWSGTMCLWPIAIDSLNGSQALSIFGSLQ